MQSEIVQWFQTNANTPAMTLIAPSLVIIAVVFSSVAIKFIKTVFGSIRMLPIIVIILGLMIFGTGIGGCCEHDDYQRPPVPNSFHSWDAATQQIYLNRVPTSLVQDSQLIRPMAYVMLICCGIGLVLLGGIHHIKNLSSASDD